MDKNELIKQWEAEENHAFQGWDFSHISNRWHSPNPPWDYASIVKSYLKESDTLLDMGTGGGEVLLSINHPHKNTYATEAYEPNFELCKKTLSPLGITVARTYTDENFNSDDKIPFDDQFFNVVINRHDSFDLAEVDRVLKPGGYFITQQVGEDDCNEFAKMLNDNYVYSVPGHSLENYTDTLIGMDYDIIKTDEAKYPVKFFDVGALVFYAKIIAWEFPNFSVKTHLQKLLHCHQKITDSGSLQGTGHSFYFVAKKTT